ncbi:retropepsin-like domain-containing protein [Candidatus Bipolaricaulota bacterium]|nr:retropepsin-like domain-containing protein [Candidatus Bipolaricaulota bacterium]
MTQHAEQPQPNCGSQCKETAFSTSLGIPMRINGQGPYWVSVDTGAGLTVVLPEVAEELGLNKVGEETRRGVGGPVTIDLVGVKSVEADGVDVSLAKIGVGAFLKKLCGQSFQGNLGYDILQHGRLIADFSGERMEFQPCDAAPAEGVRFRIASAKKPLVIVDTMVNGTGPYRFALDTGAMGTCIAPGLAEALGATRGQVVQVAGVGGAMDAYFTTETMRFSIGDTCRGELSPFVIDIFDAIAPDTGSVLSGIIGQDIMRQYIVTFDYGHNIISVV